jgi:hypothetical protein
MENTIITRKWEVVYVVAAVSGSSFAFPCAYDPPESNHLM